MIIDQSEIAVKISKEISRRCDKKVEFSVPYPDDSTARRAIFVDGEKTNISWSPSETLVGEDLEEAFITAIVNKIKEIK